MQKKIIVREELSLQTRKSGMDYSVMGLLDELEKDKGEWQPKWEEKWMNHLRERRNNRIKKIQQLNSFTDVLADEELPNQ